MYCGLLAFASNKIALSQCWCQRPYTSQSLTSTFAWHMVPLGVALYMYSNKHVAVAVGSIGATNNVRDKVRYSFVQWTCCWVTIHDCFLLGGLIGSSTILHIQICCSLVRYWWVNSLLGMFANCAIHVVVVRSRSCVSLEPRWANYLFVVLTMLNGWSRIPTGFA